MYYSFFWFKVMFCFSGVCFATCHIKYAVAVFIYSTNLYNEHVLHRTSRVCVGGGGVEALFGLAQNRSLGLAVDMGRLAALMINDTDRE
ncbi:hypothetical protein L1987_56759 [Smallanthus sonchifolius]|uniref:Uncharacterized protein n=1 Tax=Smallanthus sonchifolius TaxID=185202 RepID=A0ACB9DB48_9ASTR|nr:hypothetical protein L1987_56759 [Smallanthus sonchifolius]